MIQRTILGSDTVTLNGASDVEIGEVVEHTADSEPVVMEARGPSCSDSIFQLGFSESDGGVHQPSTRDAFSARHVERGVPFSAPVALKEIVDGAEVNNTIWATRAWKLLLLLPRILLFRPTRGGLVPRKKLEARFRQFQGGEWMQLLGEHPMEAHSRSTRRSRRSNNDDEAQRAARALSRVQLGELSAARQALEGAAVAPGTLATLAALTNPEKRPPVPKQPITLTWHRSNPLNSFSWTPMRSWCVCENPGEAQQQDRLG